MDIEVERVKSSRNERNEDCSCCFEEFTDEAEPVTTTVEIKRWFFDLTQVELNRPRKVCRSCFKDLKYFSNFRSRMIENQRVFLKSLAETDIMVGLTDRAYQSELKKVETLACDPLVTFVDVKIESMDLAFDNAIEEPVSKTVSSGPLDVDDSTDLAECPDCFQFFASSNIARHITEIHLGSSTTTKYSCDKCSYVSAKTSRLEKHCDKFHQSLPPKPDRKSHNVESNRRKQCPTCGIFVKHLSEHQKMVHIQVKRFRCDFCNYSCYFKTKITRHIQRHIPKHLREQFPCDYPDCNFFATRKDALKSHVLTMHQIVREKVCLCIECGKSFYNKSQLNIHVKAVHEKVKNHLCNLCGKSFFNVKDMEMHVKRHGVKDMACEICGNLFYCSLDLRRHLKIHSEPTITCDVVGCEKRFYTNHKLKMHVKIRHEGAKDYFCDYCSSRFSQYNNLKRHVNSVHKSLRINCLVNGCNYSVARKDKYKNHLTSQHKFLDSQSRESILKSVKFE